MRGIKDYAAALFLEATDPSRKLFLKRLWTSLRFLKRPVPSVRRPFALTDHSYLRMVLAGYEQLAQRCFWK